MEWLLLAIATLGFVEIMLRLPIKAALGQLQDILAKVRRMTSSSAISDHWKQKAMLAYALGLFKVSLRFTCYLAVSLLPVMLSVGAGRMLSLDVLALLSTFSGLVVAMVLAVGYVKVRTAFDR
jgi:hypothetical protein